MRATPLQENGGYLFILLLLAALTACSDGAANRPLETPQNFTLTPSGPHQVTLSWSAIAPATAHFAIERSDNDGTYTAIAEVAPDVLEYVDDGVSSDNIYVYKVYTEEGSRQSGAVYSNPYHHPFFDACSTPIPAQTASSVVFYDMPVSGLTYRTTTTYAVSDTDGSFAWDQGSDIQFSIGYVTLGSLHAGDRPGILPLAKNIGGRPETTLLNLLRLFMALDQDSDTTNGIQLPCDLSLAYGAIDPTVDKDSFAQQETVLLLAAAAGAILPTAQQAETLYEQYLYHDYVGHYQVEWSAIIGGLIPVGATFSFDLDKNGTIYNTPESVIHTHLDPHDYYHLEIVDLAALALSSLGYYQLEIDAHIQPDQTIQGRVVLKSISLGDTTGSVWGGRN